MEDKSVELQSQEPQNPQQERLSTEKIQDQSKNGTTAAEEPAQADETNASDQVYTIFSASQKSKLRLLLGLATITSPLTATMYFPLLPLLQTKFDASAQAINLTLTIYIVFQAISPAIFGPLSDNLGRRPVYLFTLAIYAAGNLGLSLNRNSYAALVALRAVQSLGASAAFAVSYGVVADVCVPSDRGSMVGPVSMALNLGACIGPVIGGWVAYSSGDVQWVFWSLLIIGALLWVYVAILLPETARKVVGNGSALQGLKWWETDLLTAWSRYRKARGNEKKQEGSESTCNVGQDNVVRESFWKRCRIRNPLACLRIIFYLDTLLILWMHGSFYTVDYSLVAVTPDIFKNIYGFNELQIGLSYLCRGVGIIVGGFCNGKLMDHNYKVIAKRAGWTIDKVKGDDLYRFPIERARARGSYILLIVSTATLIAYGWIVNARVHVSVPLILQFVQGFFGTCFYTTYNTLLIDCFPDSPSTAAATASIVRCAMAATGVAVLQPLLDAAGRSWYFTVLGLWSGIFGVVAVFLINRNGMKWRQRRQKREKHADT